MVKLTEPFSDIRSENHDTILLNVIVDKYRMCIFIVSIQKDITVRTRKQKKKNTSLGNKLPLYDVLE